MIQIQVTEKEVTLIATALQAYAEDLNEAASAVLSPFLKRSLRSDHNLVTNLIGRCDPSAADKVIRDYLAQGDKIGAIKYYRAVSGLGLKEAKDYVDSLQ